jgi:hypothetical protein
MLFRQLQWRSKQLTQKKACICGELRELHGDDVLYAGYMEELYAEVAAIEVTTLSNMVHLSVTAAASEQRYSARRQRAYEILDRVNKQEAEIQVYQRRLRQMRNEGTAPNGPEFGEAQQLHGGEVVQRDSHSHSFAQDTQGDVTPSPRSAYRHAITKHTRPHKK